MSPFDLSATADISTPSPATLRDTSVTPLECTFDIVFGLMLPIYLAAARGDLVVARAALCDLLDAHDAVSAGEIELVSRIHTLSHIAMDSMNRSLRSDLSDTKVLRYRASAIAMLRTAEQCRKTLEAMQTRRRASELQNASDRHQEQIDAFADDACQRLARLQSDQAQDQAKAHQAAHMPGAPQPPVPRMPHAPMPKPPAPPKPNRHARDTAALPERELTEAEIEALRRETMEILSRGEALFGPYIPPATAQQPPGNTAT